MSLPKAAFLDTNVFVGQQFNYASTIFTSFVPVSRNEKLKILLPEPTAKEIARHIRDRSAEALKALEEARRKAPFLGKWKHFPPKQTSLAQWEVNLVAQAEWNKFLQQFDIEELSYDGVSINKIMSWYHTSRAPFGEGKKKKEFPDAFAVEIVSLYAEKHGICVAVVSDDQDIKKACEYYPSLLYFQSLPQLTELLLVGDEKLAALKAVLNENLSLLQQAVEKEIFSFNTYLSRDGYDEVDASIGEPELINVRVVGIGNKECTVVFDAIFDSEHKIKWEEIVDPVEGYTQTFTEWFSQSNSISGTAKLFFDPEAKLVTSVGMVDVEGSEIEVEFISKRY